MAETASINISDDDDAAQLSGGEEVHHDNASSIGGKSSSLHAANQVGGANGSIGAASSNAGSKINDLATNLFKWTNYIHGWQERYIVLKDGVLSYYKSQTETQFGCRGAIALKQSSIIPHDLDDCRFDIRVNDCVWYLRAKTVEERQRWLDALEEHRLESGYGSQTSLRRHGSMLSLNSAASLSVASTGSYKRGLGLKEKLSEMETFRDILCRQVETLQTYFDACANSLTKGFEPYHKELEKLAAAASDVDDDDDEDEDEKKTTTNKLVKDLNKATVEDHAAMALDFKGEAFTFKATTTGILHDLAHCIELMQQREEFWKKKLEKEVEKRKKVEEHYKELSKGKKNAIIIAGPDLEEGPHSIIKEDQFFDAIDSTLDTLEQEEERRVEAFESRTKLPEVTSVVKHRFTDEINRIIDEHLRIDLQDDLNSNMWELLCSDGEMKIYRRELEENGLVLDPLKAVHTVKGITGHELCKYFWDPAVRMEWEGTLDSSRVVEALADDTLIFHQLYKRVWPAAQRDTCFWSHIRSVPKEKKVDADGYETYPDWIVVNYSTEHEKAPAERVRAVINVALICETKVRRDKSLQPSTTTNSNRLTSEDVKIPPPSPPTSNRNDIISKITYVAFINPGGWAPANVLRAVYKREYPRFVKRFTQYVTDKTAKLPILF